MAMKDFMDIFDCDVEFWYRNIGFWHDDVEFMEILHGDVDYVVAI